MSLKRSTFIPLILLAGLVIFSSCQKHAADDRPVVADSAYFSIKQFAADQMHTYYGAPYTLHRISHLDGSLDSTMVTFFNMDWSSILNTFFATDISARKYLGKYSFSMSDDETTGGRGYMYTATDPDIFTRTLQINTDPSNNRITSIYIETAKGDFFGSKSQKLLYVPLRIIQIQETEHNLFRKARNLRIDYRFMEADEVEQL